MFKMLSYITGKIWWKGSDEGLKSWDELSKFNKIVYKIFVVVTKIACKLHTGKTLGTRLDEMYKDMNEAYYIRIK